ncbi:cytochrome c-type biogenesis protein [Magnetospirillum gryphiswaldense]|uniref:Cytochrome c-type biogenesis protein n=2 Tax=Magnetospirillum gryphiswaldense TaxID=55518 RepID=V6F7X9_MAGGM|nr:cytochrome c-type biogenesis protein [Magnetospirillum gryphiswaldense]AVM75385.1 Cytochrome c-type biogenesis protein CcmH precursor [Magnetospirillum gryphiswaldense MSR-1]AVM79288.1 Cytochrome c-type biogenesis protein CcmH precursor [Magnetospirillum gryphiswaldense]CAM77640.1 Cytochrome C biogenesis protein [Magnetospirillum gryphiswaldense MSR-1]CDL00406.1 Cytochrome c-type biogenesis protein cycL precursor [Magnetospirillum gryphiswaldense MSR-1 v2]
MKRLALALMLAAAAPALAADPSEMLKDPVLEKKAEDLGKELRCLVCQNESIEDSNADLARDLRIIVRERIAKGESTDQVKQYVVDRYGDYVLLNPPFKGATLVLWLGPFALLVVAVGAAFVFFRRRPSVTTTPVAPLSAEEKRRLDALLKDEDRS